MNATKLNVDFDSDDFFNTFEPTKAKQETTSLKVKNTSKLQEVTESMDNQQSSKNQSFQMNSNNYSNQASFGDSTNNFGGVDDAKARLMSLGNKKGISSEDIFGQREIKSQEVKDKYASLTGARAISSDMFFGTNDGGKEDDGDGFSMGKDSYNKSKFINNKE